MRPGWTGLVRPPRSHTFELIALLNVFFSFFSVVMSPDHGLFCYIYVLPTTPHRGVWQFEFFSTSQLPSCCDLLARPTMSLNSSITFAASDKQECKGEKIFLGEKDYWEILKWELLFFFTPVMRAKILGLVEGDVGEGIRLRRWLQVLCEKNCDSAKVTLPLWSQFYPRKAAVAKNYREQRLTVLQDKGV